jgi:hypothetical protein
MSTGLVVVDVTVFLAAALQAATGIGFGVLAGPIMLVVSLGVSSEAGSSTSIP